MNRVDTTEADMRQPPGTERAQNLRPRLRFELIGCGLRGHELLGTDVAHIRPQDALVAWEGGDGLRWYRCLRCDSWLPLLPPDHPDRRHLPPRDQITLPLRGKALRDRYVLRLIAVDRFVHFIVLALLAAVVLIFRKNEAVLDSYWIRILRDLQAGTGGPVRDTSTGLVGELNKLFRVNPIRLLFIGMVLAGYALLEVAEAVGLWLARRWAEYLTLVATAILLIPEAYELARRVLPLKVIALVVNLAVVIYLLCAKRLFGLRGGGRAQRAERERDNGWDALQRTVPGPTAGWAGPATPPCTSSSRVVSNRSSAPARR
jgi:uncharacterized membrane protein (DUF2068 family)